MRPLTLVHTLEFYDVPQIIVAIDPMGTRYLCTLYSQGEDGFQYIGVQISEPRLTAFIGGQLDLRDAYLHPEAEGAVWIVSMKSEQLTATRQIQGEDISEDMLPEAGYFYESSDLTDDGDSAFDTYQLIVPVNDRLTFSTIISRMGWRASVLHQVHSSPKQTVS